MAKHGKNYQQAVKISDLRGNEVIAVQTLEGSDG